AGCQLFLFVIVDLEQQTAALRLERSVRRAGRPAGVGAGTELLAALAVPVVADDQVARNEVHLFPVVVHEGIRRVHAGREPQLAAGVRARPLLVERARQYLLLDAFRITLRRLPAPALIGLVELLVFLMDSHMSLRSQYPSGVRGQGSGVQKP